MEDYYTVEEAFEALSVIKDEYPSVYRWFFLYQIEKNREKNDSLRNQAPSRQASGTGG